MGIAFYFIVYFKLLIVYYSVIFNVKHRSILLLRVLCFRETLIPVKNFKDFKIDNISMRNKIWNTRAKCSDSIFKYYFTIKTLKTENLRFIITFIFQMVQCFLLFSISRSCLPVSLPNQLSSLKVISQRPSVDIIGNHTNLPFRTTASFTK